MLGKHTFMTLALVAALLCFGSKVTAQTPKSQLQGTIERIIEVLRTIRSVEDIERNKALLQQVILTRFDFAEMARTALGTHWGELNGRESEFVSAFTQFIENAYFGTLGSYQGEKIAYGRERADQEFAEVETQVVGGRGPGIDVEYKLHLVSGEWKVYDVVIDQVSMVTNYRSQFKRVLQTASLEELLRRLREKGSGPQS